MRIQYKSALVMFLVGTVSLFIISTAYFFKISSSSLAYTLTSVSENVEELAYHIQEQMKKDSQLAYTLANAPLITESLRLSNSNFAALTREDRDAKIIGLNKKWMEIKDVENPFIQTYMNNPVASYLEKQQKMFPKFFGEIFLTNRYGVIIATTKKLTTLAHAHKYWWMGSHYGGKGRVFFDDRGYDESVKGYVLGITIPVMEDDAVIGILKCNIKILESYNHFFDGYTENKPGTYSLVRSKGLIVFEKGIEPLSRTVHVSIIEKIKNWVSGSQVITMGDTRQIIAWAPVQITKGTDQSGFGGSYKSIDHIKGNKGEGWVVVFSRDLQELTTASEKLIQGIVIIGLVFILLMAVSASFVGRKMATPVIKLAKMAKRIGKGDFKTEINFSSKDELGDLANSFNKMVRSLHETTTSRNKLRKEINQRERAEQESKKLETQLRQAKKMEAIYTMAGGIAHNFNNLLSIIHGYVDLVREDIPKEHPTQSYLNDILTATNRATELVSYIMMFSDHANSTNDTILPGIVLSEYLESIVDKLPGNVIIEQRISSDTGSIRIEAKQFKLAADKLCMNALWAMGNSGGILGVTLENTEIKSDDILVKFDLEPGHFIKFNVSDTGHGIVSTDLERIFDPFFTTKNIGEGDGIGLSVALGIVKKSGGAITVESEVDKGSTFNIYLPVAKNVLGEDPVPATNKPFN